MFRKIFQRIYFIIIQPAKEWRKLGEEEIAHERFLAVYFYPLLGILTLAAFVGNILSTKTIELALKISIQEVVAFFSGFYLSVFLLKEIINRKFTAANIKRTSCFIVYASSLIYMIAIVVSLFGEQFQVIYLLLPYTVYIIWEGARAYMGIREEQQISFSIVSSLIVLIPYLIRYFIDKFMLITPHAGG
ncbi:MAG: YIP1 family protein [Dysgonamonadaceae bacterium]|jgi:hypothetical protein|nr:YIP1 family protein [Dysgonamonadaceae bacterium]